MNLELGQVYGELTGHRSLTKSGGSQTATLVELQPFIEMQGFLPPAVIMFSRYPGSRR